jgi:hypothetical protein
MEKWMLEMVGIGTYATRKAPGYHQAKRNEEVVGLPHQNIAATHQV